MQIVKPTTAKATTSELRTKTVSRISIIGSPG
ncbi:MAG: hypothetical protein ACI9IQ_001861 [Cyclobacteriaceae bacterium]